MVSSSKGWQGMPITMAEIQGRQERLRRALAEADLPGALAVGRGFFDRPGSMAYLTGHIPPFITAPFAGEGAGVGLGVAILPVDGEPVVIDTYPSRPDRTPVRDLRASTRVLADTLAALREKGLGSGPLAVVDGDLLPWAFARALGPERLVPFDAPVARMRAVKSPAEVEAIRAAARVADAGLRAVREALRPGATERAICAAGQAAALAAGADFVRYLRVHSGPWAFGGARWPQAMDRVLQPGDYVSVDIIGAADGYGFDVLRCFVAGEPSAAQRRLTEAAGEVTAAVAAACRPGATVADLRAAARARAEALGYGDALGDFLGHGIGMETMEWPLLAPGDVLEPGMVLCVEPRLKVAGVGNACVEEEVAVTEGEPERLTVTPYC
jgi:Xaa-Pro aminopeptidase